ncbi:hypothetical protein A2U01_0106434, partial [Trifolium medium]|nr:hypothetical protein [Trifolium medium]
NRRRTLRIRPTTDPPSITRPPPSPLPQPPPRIQPPAAAPDRDSSQSLFSLG